jgi:hypothetical protein
MSSCVVFVKQVNNMVKQNVVESANQPPSLGNKAGDQPQQQYKVENQPRDVNSSAENLQQEPMKVDSKHLERESQLSDLKNVCRLLVINFVVITIKLTIVLTR